MGNFSKHDIEWFYKHVGTPENPGIIYRHEENKEPTLIYLRTKPQAKFLFWIQEQEGKRYFDDGEKLN